MFSNKTRSWTFSWQFNLSGKNVYTDEFNAFRKVVPTKEKADGKFGIFKMKRHENLCDNEALCCFNLRCIFFCHMLLSIFNFCDTQAWRSQFYNNWKYFQSRVNFSVVTDELIRMLAFIALLLAFLMSRYLRASSQVDWRCRRQC